MPARHALDPLVLVPLRLPRSLVDAAKAEVDASGCTLSDAIRSRIASSAVKPLGLPRPRKRPALSVDRVSRCNPELVRQIAAIGSNLNQIARAANVTAATGTELQMITLLAQLCAIERTLGSLVRKRNDDER